MLVENQRCEVIVQEIDQSIIIEIDQAVRRVVLELAEAVVSGANTFDFLNERFLLGDLAHVQLARMLRNSSVANIPTFKAMDNTWIDNGAMRIRKAWDVMYKTRHIPVKENIMLRDILFGKSTLWGSTFSYHLTGTNSLSDYIRMYPGEDRENFMQFNISDGGGTPLQESLSGEAILGWWGFPPDAKVRLNQRYSLWFSEVMSNIGLFSYKFTHQSYDT